MFKGEHLIGQAVTNPWVDWFQWLIDFQQMFCHWGHFLILTQKKIAMIEKPIYF